MFGAINKGAPTSTQTTTPSWRMPAAMLTPAANDGAADAWGGMREAQQPNMLKQMQYAVQARQDKINNLPPDQKRRLEAFNKMAMTPPEQTKFSPVQFGGGNVSPLSELVLQLRNRVNQGG